MPKPLVTLRAALGLASAQLRHYRIRTLLTVVAITFAVLSTTLLASVGVGVLETGQQRLDASQQDLWITQGPVRLTPASGGFGNPITNAHTVARKIRRSEAVRIAAPIAFQTVYVGRSPTNLKPIVGVGVPNVGERVLSLQSGPGFQHGDVHYANGNYTGAMTYEVIIDERTASLFNVSVGDQLYIGGTLTSARNHRFHVVGISSTFSRFLGTPTVAVHLSELQEVTGTTGTDPATIITVTLAPGADPTAVQRDLQTRFPEYEVRTNRQQLQAFVQDRVFVLASAATLVGLAVITGIALTAYALALIVYQQRTELAALKASGVSSTTLATLIGSQALILSSIGGVVGLGATPVFVRLMNAIASRLVGFENLVRTPIWVFVVGLGIALGIGMIGALVAGWRVIRLSPLDNL